MDFSHWRSALPLMSGERPNSCAACCNLPGPKLQLLAGPSNGSTLNFVPPNSAAFSTKSNPVGFCSFYLWASQMFLWLTSTDAISNFTVFSPTFYTAVETPTGFTFVQNAENSLTAGLGSKSLFHVRVNKSKVSLATLLKLKAAAAQGQPTPANETGQAGGGGVLIVNGQPVAVPATRKATPPIRSYTTQSRSTTSTPGSLSILVKSLTSNELVQNWGSFRRRSRRSSRSRRRPTSRAMPIKTNWHWR